MNRSVLSSVKLAALLFMMSVKADEGSGEVSFSWGRDFTMTCPGQGDWFLKGIANETGFKTLKHPYENDLEPLNYHCKYKDSSDNVKFYHFFVRGKACEWCVEATKPVILTILFVDLLVTGLVIMLVYLRTKRSNNNAAGPAAAASKPAAAGRRKAARGGGGPPTPSPDYEQLNIHTRSPDTYSTVHRMG